MTEILECFRTGANSLWSSLFAPRIDRIVLAATKADHLHHQSHDRLEAILAKLAGRAMARAEFAGAEVKVLALAAVRATREGEARRNGETLPCIVGYPLAGETIGRRTFDGNEEFAIFPGDLPADPEACADGLAHRAWRHALRALPAAQSRPGPFRRLRALPKYPPRPRHPGADRGPARMSKTEHRKPAAFRVEEVEVLAPPVVSAEVEPASLPGPRAPRHARSRPRPSLGQHPVRRARRSRQPARFALALRLRCCADRARRLDRLGGRRRCWPSSSSRS